MTLPLFCMAAIVAIAVTAVIRGYILEGQRDKARNESADNDRRAQAFERHARLILDERNEAIAALRMAVERENWRAVVAKLPMSFGVHVSGGDA
jgi:hypothetical protein